jgi:hypothetical protein
MSMKNSNDCDLPVCSAVPQPTTPQWPRNNKGQSVNKYIEHVFCCSDFIIFYSFIGSDCTVGWIVLKKSNIYVSHGS